MSQPSAGEFAPLPSRARRSDVLGGGAAQALHLACDDRLLAGATPAELSTAVASLAKAPVPFSDVASRDPRRVTAIASLEVAGRAIGDELRRRGG